jgi:hypothetical protein
MVGLGKGYVVVVVDYILVGRRVVVVVVEYMFGWWYIVVAHLDVDVGHSNNDRRTHMTCNFLYIDSENWLSA